MNLSQFLKTKLKYRGLTRNGLYVEMIRIFGAHEAVASSTIADIINKGRRPKPDTIKKLSQALNCSYEEMMQAAGYIENTKSDELSAYLLDESVKSAIISPSFRGLMQKVHELTPERREAILQGFLAMLKGMS